MRYSNPHPSDIIAALSTSLLYTLGSYSFATLIFGGTLLPYLIHGFNLILMSNIVACLIGSRFSSYPLMASLTQPTELAIYVLIASQLVINIESKTPIIDPIYTVYFAIILITAIVGICLWLMGMLRMGNVVRFIPFPVILAFLAASGWVLVVFSVKVIFGESINYLNLNHLNDLNSTNIWNTVTEHQTLQFVLSLCIVISIILLQSKINRAIIEPVVYVLAILVFYLILWIANISIDYLRGSDWFVRISETAGNFSNPLTLLSFSKVHWASLFDWNIIGNFLALLIISPMFLLLSLNGIERETRHEFNYNSELKYTGITNILSPLVGGGAIGSASLSGTLRNHQLGGTSRWVGIFIAAFFYMALIFHAFILKIIPLFLVASLPLMTGINLLRTWLINIKKQLVLSDYILLWVIFLSIVFYGFLAGIILGFFASLILFDYRYSKINIVRNVVKGSDLQSNNERGMAADSLLKNLREGIEVIILQGYLFFGNINTLIETLISKIDNKDEKISFIILDFKNVEGMDPSSAESFLRLYFHAKKREIKLIFSDIPENQFKIILSFLKISEDNDSCLKFKNLDLSLEYCEEYFLKKRTNNWNTYFAGQLHAIFPNESELKIFMNYLKYFSVTADTTIFNQNTLLDKIYFLDQGVLELYHVNALGNRTRVRTIYPGVFVGEMGFYFGMKQPFSCDAKVKSSLYSLSFNNLIKLEKMHPRIAIEFHRFLVRQSLNRLTQDQKTMLSLL